MKKLLLIDGMAVIYRAYYALNSNSKPNSKGLNTSAILGFTTTILDLIQKLKPTHMAVSFDLPAPTFRHEAFPEYKANRQPTPEDILISIPYVKQVVEAFNIPIICKEGFEADDIIGTLAHTAEQRGFDEVFMATPDKDFAQLVTSVVKIYRFGRMKTPDTIMGISEVQAKFHVSNCKQVIDLLGLWGDAIDNIPGIPGVGEKSAQKLIAQFGSIENMVARSSEISNNYLRQLVQEHSDAAIQSKYLATIVTNAPIEFNEELMLLKEPNYPQVKELFDFLEFRQLSKRVIPSSVSAQLSSVSKPAPTNNGQLDLFAPEASDDTRVTSLTDLQVPEYENLNIPNAVRVGDTIVCYDLKKLLPTFNQQGISTQQVFDVMLAHYLIDAEARHEFSFIVSQRLGIELENTTPQDALAALYPILKAELERQNLTQLYSKVELPLVEVLSSMEHEGVMIDVDALKQYSAQLSAEREQIENHIYELVGHTFNISSPKQLGIVLFDELRITDKPPLTPSKQYSTSEEALLKLKSTHPIISEILEYRSISKLIGTYLDSFPKLINPTDGRLHTIYNQAVTATGRLSSSNPNLQNIPIRTERGRFIRQAFVARNQDYELLAADYSQIELRLIADLSCDTNMIEAFTSGQDIHAATAAKIYHINIQDVTKDQRRNAKSVNFGIVYGISTFGLSEQLGCSRHEAQQLISDYFEQFPAIKQLIDNMTQSARTNGYASTAMGRRRYLPEINSRNGSLRNFAERNAVNMPVQGTSADMIKLAMVQIYQELKQRNLRSKMILQVHDELVFDVYKPEMAEVRQIVEKGMLDAAHQLCQVPIEVGIDVGDNWLQAH